MVDLSVARRYAQALVNTRGSDGVATSTTGVLDNAALYLLSGSTLDRRFLDACHRS